MDEEVDTSPTSRLLDLILLWHNLLSYQPAQLLLPRGDVVVWCCSKTSFMARLSLILCECGNCATLAVIGNSICHRQRQRQSHRHRQRQWPDKEANKRATKVNLSLLLITHTTRWLELNSARRQLQVSFRFFFSAAAFCTWHVLIELHTNCPCKLQLQPRGGNCIALDILLTIGQCIAMPAAH